MYFSLKSGKLLRPASLRSCGTSSRNAAPPSPCARADGFEPQKQTVPGQARLTLYLRPEGGETLLRRTWRTNEIIKTTPGRSASAVESRLLSFISGFAAWRQRVYFALTVFPLCVYCWLSVYSGCVYCAFAMSLQRGGCACVRVCRVIDM